jgi:hypothetical protein
MILKNRHGYPAQSGVTENIRDNDGRRPGVSEYFRVFPVNVGW